MIISEYLEGEESHHNAVMIMKSETKESEREEIKQNVNFYTCFLFRKGDTMISPSKHETLCK